MTMWRGGLRTLVLLPLWAAVAGCGPGVGGTGTGEGFSLDFFGARAASVCTAAFAESLKCPSRIVIGPSRVDLSAGSELVQWVDDPAAARIDTRIEGSDIEFRALCEGVRFAGTWGTRPDGTSRFFGNYVLPGSETTLPGIMEADTQTAALTLTLRDINGAVVLGPIALQRAETVSTSVEPSCVQAGVSPQRGTTYR